MHIFKAAYCRLYQLGFRAAMPILPYTVPVELDSLGDIPGKLRELGVVSALLVTDTSIRGMGLTAPLEEAMAEAGLSCPVFDGVVPNPTVSVVEQALRLYLQEGCGAVIGFGGGSSMDCAKAVAARAGLPKKSLRQLAGNLRIHHRLSPIFAVPTTAGTGSETTLTAVITDDETRHKVPMNDFS